MLALLVYVSILACGGGSDGGSGGGDGGSGITFSASDLEGTWSHLYKGSTVYGSLTMGTDGTITPGGSYNEIGVSDKTYTDGALLITNSGTVSGSLTTSDTSIHNIPISGGQMSRDKRLIAIAGTKPDAEMGLFIKSGAGFSTPDLNGQWSFGNQNGYGTFTVSDGPITGSYTAITPPPASSGTLSGTLTITGAGVIGGAFNIGTVQYKIENGQLSSDTDKTVLYIALSDNATNADNAFVAVRMNAKFGADALGTDTYKFVSFSDIDPKVAYGTITMTSDINGTSTVNGGAWTQIGPGAAAGTYDPGTTVNIGTDGVVSDGTLTAQDSSNSTTTTFEILSGQVSSNRNFSINISEEAGGDDGASQITLLVRTP